LFIDPIRSYSRKCSGLADAKSGCGIARGDGVCVDGNCVVLIANHFAKYSNLKACSVLIYAIRTVTQR
jgi:hypothetical protein